MEKLIKKLENELEQQREFLNSASINEYSHSWGKGYCKALCYCLRQLKLFQESQKKKE